MGGGRRCAGRYPPRVPTAARPPRGRAGDFVRLPPRPDPAAAGFTGRVSSIRRVLDRRGGTHSSDVSNISCRPRVARGGPPHRVDLLRRPPSRRDRTGLRNGEDEREFRQFPLHAIRERAAVGPVHAPVPRECADLLNLLEAQRERARRRPIGDARTSATANAHTRHPSVSRSSAETASPPFGPPRRLRPQQVERGDRVEGEARQVLLPLPGRSFGPRRAAVRRSRPARRRTVRPRGAAPASVRRWGTHPGRRPASRILPGRSLGVAGFTAGRRGGRAKCCRARLRGR